MRPGYKTTEFWLSLAAILVAALSAADIFEMDSAWAKVLAFAGSTLVALGYDAARAFVKVAEAKAAAEVEAARALPPSS